MFKLFFLSLLSSVHSTAVPVYNSLETHLPVWYQAQDHPTYSLFSSPSTLFSAEASRNISIVGSPEWLSLYPEGDPDSSRMPSAWSEALAAAIDKGKIPDIHQSIQKFNSNPVYPAGVDPNDASVCSSTYGCHLPGDIWDAPSGHIGIAFDDGPTEATPGLLQFCKDNDQQATHFMIGAYIRKNPQMLLQAVDQGDDIAVHTYTHAYLTTLSNLDIVAQLGYTMAIIMDSTGRLPKYYRPPYGDCDMRVQAIAREVFGLTAIFWNQDPSDWHLSTGDTTSQKIASSMEKWLSGPKSPGLLILEHELTNATVQSFIDAYPMMKTNGWTLTSAALMTEGNAYQDAKHFLNGDEGEVDLNRYSNNFPSSSDGPISSSMVSSYHANASAILVPTCSWPRLLTATLLLILAQLL